MRAPYPYLDELVTRYGETFTLPLFGLTLVTFLNFDHVREIFSDGGDDLEAGRFNRTLAPLLGDRSVLMVDGKQHLRKRKLLLPPFHGERMQAYGRTMLEIADDAIDQFPIATTFSLHPLMQDITLRVIIRTIFGFEGARQAEMVKKTKRLLDLGAWPPLLLPFMQVDFGRLSPYGRFRRAVEESDKLLYAAIDERRRDGTRGEDILSLLLDGE
jgi:cytochrome P450